MTDVKFSARAFCKMILHAIKYPHCAINGVLLAKPRSGSKEVEFLDAIPLFHVCLNLTPMAEIALMQIDELAATMGLVIAGYYGASENLRDNTLEKIYHKIADKIAVNYSPSFLVALNNISFNAAEGASRMKVAQLYDGGFKSIDEHSISLLPSEATCETVISFLQQAKDYKSLVDFDNHLDDIRLDWLNIELNESIEKLI